MTISVIGTGYVGLTSAALFASAGVKTYVIDVDKDRLNSVRQGKSFFYEKGLDPLISHCINNKTLIPTDSYNESIPRSNIIFSCVGTPDKPDGSSNLEYVFMAARQALECMKDNSVYVQKSTVPVGTGRKIESLFKLAEKDISYVSNPEFLREGTAILDSLWFERIVVGGDQKEALKQVVNIYKKVEDSRALISKITNINAPERSSTGQYIMTELDSAELIKVTSNAFLALKISFANSIAKLADKTGANISEVMDATGADSRIGRSFFNAGRGYGGGCFPKDVSGLIKSGLSKGIKLEIMEAAVKVNNSMPDYIIQKLINALEGNLESKSIAILGLSFKPDTSDTRRSPAIRLANLLAAKGACVQAYDPKAMEEAKKTLHKNIILTDSKESALKNADAVLVATNWQEFLDLSLVSYKKLLSGNIFFDCMNSFKPSSVSGAGLHYIGVGRGGGLK